MRPPRLRTTIALLTVFAAPARAQDAAFSWARASVGATWMEPSFPDGDFWDPARGVALRLQTPLRPGLLSFGAERRRARALADVTDPSVDRMTWSLLYLGWGAERGLGPLRLGLEGRLGALVNTAPEAVSNRTERELVVGASGWLALGLPGGWFVRAETSAARVQSSRSWSARGSGLAVGRRLGLGGFSRVLRAPDPLEPPPVVAAGVREAGETLDPEEAGLTRHLATAGRWASFPEIPGEVLGDLGASTDRVDRLWSPGALRAPEMGAPAIWLDGIPVRDMTLGGSAWPALPIGSADLARVHSTAEPALVAGRPELEGVLHATTAPPRPGDRVRIHGMIVNESGDPGPLRFTPLTAPNVDGPLYEFDASGSHLWSDGWLLVSAALRERWSVTRPELRSRNPAFTRGSESRARTGGVNVAVGERVGRGDLRLRAWSSGVDRFLRTPGLGAELGVAGESRGVGASVRVPLGAADTLRAYAAHARWLAVAPGGSSPPAGDPRVLDWSERDLDLGLSYRRMLGGIPVTVGGDLRRARDGQRSTRRDFGGHATAELGTAGWAHRLTAVLGSDDYGRGVLVGSRREIRAHGWIGVSAAVTTGGPKGALELVEVAAADTALVGALGIAIAPAAGEDARDVYAVERGRRHAYSIEAGWSGESGLLALELFGREFDGERRPAVTYVASGTGVLGSWGSAEEGAGRVLGATVRAVAHPAPRLTVAARAQAVRPRGNGAFERWWGAAPRVRVVSSTVMRLRPGWRVTGIARGRTAVSWAGVAPLEEVPGGGSLPAGVDADIRLEGAVLGGRVQVVAGVTNVFDVDVRLHPLGAREARGLLAGFGLRF